MFCGSSDLGLHVRQHEPGTAYGNALAQSLERAAVSLKRTGAETPAVCTRLHEAARGVADARLTQVIHQRLRCGVMPHADRSS